MAAFRDHYDLLADVALANPFAERRLGKSAAIAKRGIEAVAAKLEEIVEHGVGERLAVRVVDHRAQDQTRNVLLDAGDMAIAHRRRRYAGATPQRLLGDGLPEGGLVPLLVEHEADGLAPAIQRGLLSQTIVPGHARAGCLPGGEVRRYRVHLGDVEGLLGVDKDRFGRPPRSW